MPVFITSKSVARRHGVYAIERTPPATIRATGSGTCAIIGQFPWGPAQSLTEVTSSKMMLDTLAPLGMDHTGSGYLSIIRKAVPTLKFVRVLGTGAQAATATLASSTPTNIVTVTLKYPGTAGNSVVCTVSAATDGDADHFNLTVSVSNAQGTTSDTFQNLNYSGTGDDSAPSFTSTLLVGGITKLASGVPAVGSTTCAGGTNGTVGASDYVGTAGTANRGIALLESDRTIDHFFTDDPGNSLRAAVNAGLRAHANLMTDRIAYINGPQGQSLSAAQTDVASYRSLRVCYVDSWAYILDDDGVKRLVPPAPFAASVAAQLPPSTSIAWKSSEVQTLLGGIVGLEFDRGDGAASNTEAGITTLMREIDGGFTFEAAVNTDAPVEPTKGSLNRTRMGHYIARSVVSSLRGLVDAPNVPQNQQLVVGAVDVFLGNLKAAAKFDPNHTVHILDYFIGDFRAANSQEDLDAGELTIPADVKISPAMSKIFFSINYGETVKVSTQL